MARMYSFTDMIYIHGIIFCNVAPVEALRRKLEHIASCVVLKLALVGPYATLHLRGIF